MSVLWQAYISVYVVDVDALHGVLGLGYGMQTCLSKTSQAQHAQFKHY